MSPKLAVRDPTVPVQTLPAPTNALKGEAACVMRSWMRSRVVLQSSCR